MILKELTCLKCGAPITRDGIDNRLNIAKCTHCNSIFAFSDFDNDDNYDNNNFHNSTRPVIPTPESIELMHQGNELVIKRKWFSFTYIILIFFTLFWNGFMIIWHIISFSTGAYIMSAFGALHTAVGIFLLYTTLTGLLNSSYIMINYRKISIKHKPLPWPGNIEISSNNISQIYSKEITRRTKNGTKRYYEVHSITQDGKDKKILKNLLESQQALYIEQQIETYLGISDQNVSGEIPK